MFLSNLQHSIQRMFEGFSFNTSFGKIGVLAGSFLTALYTPIALLLTSCFVFTAVDMFYGIRVAIKQHSKIESSKTWKGTLTKLFDEFSILSLARLLEYSVIGTEGVFVLTGGATVILCLTELWSILENLNTLNPSGPWRALGKFLKKKGEEHIGFEIDLKNNDNDSVDNNAS